MAEPLIASLRRSHLAVLPPKLYSARLQSRLPSRGATFATRNISGGVSSLQLSIKRQRLRTEKVKENNLNILKGNPAAIILLNVFDGRFH